MEKALYKAQEAGYKIASTGVEMPTPAQPRSLKEVMLDPEFWKCLGKSLGWGDETQQNPFAPSYKNAWHMFIDHLAEGKDPNSFFENLLSNK